MKQIAFLLFAYITILSACSKDTANQLPEGQGCIERVIIPVTAHSIAAADITTANNLFHNNGIDNSHYRYYMYLHDSVQTYFAPYAKFDDKIVKVDEYVNGLRDLTGGLNFDFINNVFNFRGGTPSNGTTLNTTPQLTLLQLRKLFIDNVEQFEHISDQFKDICLKAEFGYFNLNAGTGGAPELLIKAWKVTPKNTSAPSEYPVAYYEDKTGKLIYYFNGIQTFK